ncbi:MAG TPA: GNAT family N-acetyltransferase [Anaerolinea sp.]|nr:GNAT family N-acetyltransferase [Anaerolinea sp.]
MNIRLAQPETDIPAIAALINAYETEPVSPERIRQMIDHMPPGRITQRKVAVDKDDHVIGYGYCVHENWLPPGQFDVGMIVARERRGNGIGQALFTDAQEYLRQQNAKNLTSEVRDDDPESLRFAEKRGFSIDRHLFSSEMDLNTFDERPYESVWETQARAGIRFFNLADCQDSPEARRKLHEVNSRTVADIPGVVDKYMPFEEFERRVGGWAWYRAEGAGGAAGRGGRGATGWAFPCHGPAGSARVAGARC